MLSLINFAAHYCNNGDRLDKNDHFQALYEDKYIDVPPSNEGFIINIGTIIEDITDKRIKAVRHRVKQVDFERHSIPFFFNPS